MEPNQNIEPNMPSQEPQPIQNPQPQPVFKPEPINQPAPTVVQPMSAPIQSPITSVPPQVGGQGSKSHGLLWSIIILVLILISGGAYYFYYTSHQLLYSNSEQKSIKTLSLTELLKVEKVATPAEEKNYDEYLSRKVDAEKINSDPTNPYVQSGNVAVQAGEYGDITVAFSPIPNTNLENKNVFVNFSSVKDSDGVEMFDAESAFETDSFFTDATPDLHSDPVPYMTVKRAPHLTGGQDNSSSDIAYVKGEVEFKLPIGISSSKLTVANLSKAAATANGTTTLTKLTKGTAEFNYDGFQDKLISVSGYDVNNKPLDCSVSSSGATKGYSVTTYVVDCHDSVNDPVISYITVSDASAVIDKKVPFEADFNKGDSVATTSVNTSATTSVNGSAQATKPTNTTNNSSVISGTGAVSESDKALIVEAKVKMFEVFTSKDVSKIRSYIKDASVAANDQAQIASLDKMSDKEVLSMADFLSKIAFGGMNTAVDVRNALNAKTVSWSRDIKNGKEHVIISFPQQKDGSKTTLDAGKIGGVWY